MRGDTGHRGQAHKQSQPEKEVFFIQNLLFVVVIAIAEIVGMWSVCFNYILCKDS